MLSSRKFALYVFLLFTAVHLFISMFAIIPGYILNDEAIYHLMVRNFSETGGFEIWNGYREFPSLELAGPRSKIYFDPSKLRCALVTCGGLCPGLNDIIRAVVLELYHHYGVRNISGIRYGLLGFIPKYAHQIKDLTP